MHIHCPFVSNTLTTCCPGTATAAGDTGHELQGGRISKEALRDAVGNSKPVCMVCGPPPMTDSVVEALSHVGVSSDNVLYEKWW